MSDITRKLVTIQRVSQLDPIEGADRIEVASVLGWKIVCQKGLYSSGDLVAFFEIDSFLPIEPQYEFLRKGSYRVTKDLGEGFRLKTVKLRGQISQGLLMPLSELNIPSDLEFHEGVDLTEILKVRKWEPNAQVLLSGIAAGSFPHFVPKTDEERWQNLTREKYHWVDDNFVATRKYDGSSMTVYSKTTIGGDDVLVDCHVGVCSRNWEVKDEDGNTYWKVAKEIGLIDALKQMQCDLAFQGELVGPGVQGNPGKEDKLRFKIFNIFNIGEQRYLSHSERLSYINAINFLFKTELEGVDVSIVVTVGVVDEERRFAPIIEEFGDNVEGIVFKSIQHPERSYKYINPNYLLKDKD